MTGRASPLARSALAALPVLAVASVAVAVNAWALRHPARLDLTRAGIYSIGPETRRVIASLSRPVAVTFFYDVRSKALLDAKALLDQYAAASDRITVRAFDPLLQPSQARRYRVNFPGTAVLESGGRRVMVNGGTESDFTNGLIRVTRAAAQRVCFTDGHLEGDPYSLKTHDHFEGDMRLSHRHSTGGRRLEIHERHGMGMARDALETLGFEVRKVLLSKGPGQLAGCSVVVAAAPQRAFLPRETAQLRDYLERGGAAVVLLDPFVDAGLDGVLADFGVAYRRALVVDEERHYWTDAATPAVTSYTRHRITRNLALTFFSGAGALRPRAGGIPKGVNVVPLIETSERAQLAPLDGVTARGAPGRRTLMVLASRPVAGADKRKAQLAVVADGDFATNSFFAILGNGALFLNTVSALAGAEQLIDITPRNYEMPRIRLTGRQMRLTFALSTLLLPALLLLAGLAVWWGRR